MTVSGVICILVVVYLRTVVEKKEGKEEDNSNNSNSNNKNNNNNNSKNWRHKNKKITTRTLSRYYLFGIAEKFHFSNFNQPKILQLFFQKKNKNRTFEENIWNFRMLELLKVVPLRMLSVFLYKFLMRNKRLFNYSCVFEQATWGCQVFIGKKMDRRV